MLTPPNAGADVEQQEHLSIAGGDAQWHNRLEDSLAISYKTKHNFTI